MKDTSLNFDGFFKLKDPEKIREEIDKNIESLVSKLIFTEESFEKVKNTLVECVVEKKKFKATIKEVIVNLILSKMFIPLKKFNKEAWYSVKTYGSKIEKYFNEYIKHLDEKFTSEEICMLIADAISELSYLATQVNVKFGNTVNIYEIYKAAKRNKRLLEIMKTSFAGETDFRKIEEEITSLSKEATDILEKNSIVYRNLLPSVNFNQFKQIISCIGPRPDLFGQIVPNIVDTNYFRGLQDIEQFYIMAQTARKVLILSHKNVRSSGYLTRKLSLLCIDNNLDLTCHDCGTKHHLHVFIDSQKTLNRYRWRNAKLHESDKDYFVIDDTMTDLIGKTISVRSPITCLNKHTCPTCYGNMYLINKNLHIGILADLYLTAQLIQKLLSAKHLLQTKSPEFEWSPEFLKLFSVDKASICAVSDASGFVFIDDKEKEEDEDTGEFFTNKIHYGNNTIELPTNVYFSEALMNNLQEYRVPEGYEVGLREFRDEEMFVIKVQNEEITKSLNMIKNLIEKKDHLGATTYDDFMRKFLDLVNQNGVFIDAVHMELIISNLFRKKSNPYERIDFSKDVLEPYDILSLKEAVINGRSVCNGLSFERVKNQLLDPNIFKIQGDSFIDIFFS